MQCSSRSVPGSSCVTVAVSSTSWTSKHRVGLFLHLTQIINRPHDSWNSCPVSVFISTIAQCTFWSRRPSSGAAFSACIRPTTKGLLLKSLRRRDDGRVCSAVRCFEGCRFSCSALRRSLAVHPAHDDQMACWLFSDCWLFSFLGASLDFSVPAQRHW